MESTTQGPERQAAATFEGRRQALQDRVNEVAKALLERGVKPTVARVRSALGGGSPNDLAPALRQWKESISPAALAASGGVSGESGSLPLQIADLVHELWQRAMAAAVVEVRGGASARDLAARAGEGQVLRSQVTALRDQLQRESLAYGELRAQAARHEAIARTALARADSSDSRERALLREVGHLRQRVGELEAQLEQPTLKAGSLGRKKRRRVRAEGPTVKRKRQARIKPKRPGSKKLSNKTPKISRRRFGR